MVDWNELIHRAKEANMIRRFSAQFDGHCDGCGRQILEGDEVGYVNDEFSCNMCCDEADATLGQQY